jgi:glyoxylase I family protein
MFKRIDHIEVVPQDLARALKFYKEILGFKIKQRLKVESAPLEEVVYLELGGTVLELLGVRDAASVAAQPWQAGYRMMALEVADMDRALDYLVGQGVAVTWGPVTLGSSKRAEIQDPDGLPIELRQW